MRRVLHLLVDPEADGLAGSWQVLAEGLRRHGVLSYFAVSSDWNDRLGRLDAPRTLLPTSSSWNVRIYRDWLRVVRRTSPDLVQIWGPRGLSWVLASRAVYRTPPHLLIDDSGTAAAGWYRRLLRVVDAVVVGTESQRRTYTEAAAGRTSVVVIPPTVPALDRPCVHDLAELKRKVGLPATSQVILTAGPLEPGFGMREAVWLFDILKYTDPTLWFVVVGEGSLRSSLEDFARSLARDDFRVRFVGWQEDMISWLRMAQMVWLPGHRGGLGLLQTAAALGIPIVARQREDFAESVPHSQTLRYVPSADKHQWAKVSRELLSHLAPWCESEEALDHRGATFATDPIIGQWAQLYDRLFRGGLSRHGSALP